MASATGGGGGGGGRGGQGGGRGPRGSNQGGGNWGGRGGGGSGDWNNGGNQGGYGGGNQGGWGGNGPWENQNQGNQQVQSPIDMPRPSCGYKGSKNLDTLSLLFYIQSLSLCTDSIIIATPLFLIIQEVAGVDKVARVATTAEVIGAMTVTEADTNKTMAGDPCEIISMPAADLPLTV